ncbi:MAG TPA: CPBP family intramembrane glutamic endopeptidase [Cerasibacillus sp.]|uniref:CPBP family intramembrane glutamic endopeptidase n=1 Tax=Cerasibacillus sp. TaxID=2498711 RepID=UPI002F40A3DB
MKQSEIIKQLSDQELKKSLLLTQLSILIFSITISMFVFDQMTDWFLQIKWDLAEIFYYGVIPGIIIILFDIILFLVVPKRHLDDGGINKRLFKSMSFIEIFLFTLLIAIAEEALFRGVLQYTLGYVIASIIFALVHIRYLRKPILFLSVVLVSFFLGYIYKLTGNLLTVITAHFLVDFILGLFIHYKR